MGVLAYMAINRASLATSVSLLGGAGTSVAASGYPASGAVDGEAGTVTRTSSLQTCYLRLEFGSPVLDLDTWGVFNHNLASDVTLRLEGWNGAAWDVLDEATSGELSNASPLTSKRSFWSSFTQTSDYSILRVNLAALGSQAAAPQFGDVWLGTRTALPTSGDFGYLYSEDFRSVQVELASGGIAGYSQAQFREESFSVSDFDATERTAWLSMLRTLRGPANPVLWINDTDSADAYLARVLVSRASTAEQTAGPIYDGLTITVREQPYT